MKKTLIIGLLLFLLSISLLIKENETYAQENCHETTIIPKEVTTLNLEEIVNNNQYELIAYCSFNVCYTKREPSIKESINNFKKLFDKYLTEEEYYELNVKGYPITKIIIDSC